MAFTHLARTQKETALRLEKELASSLIPQAVLISGEQYSSRMTCAIELALNLMKAEEKFYTLDVNNLIIIPSRDIDLRIKAAENLYREQRNDSSLDFLIQSVRTYLLSFHPALAQGSEDPSFAAAGDLSDHLYTASREFTQKESDAWLKTLDSLLSSLYSKSRKRMGFTIDNIRAVTSFFQYDSESEKCVILENIEDVTTGAMNSILKVLEEPPKGAHLILVSGNPSRILDTILSRVRKYELPPISEETASAFLRDSFFASGYTSLRQFFYTKSGFDYDRAVSSASSLVRGALIERKLPSKEDFQELTTFLDSFSSYPLFFSLASDEVMALVREGRLTPYRAERALSAISLTLNDASVYNQNRRISLDRLLRELLNE